MHQIRVLLADDNAIFRQGLRRLLETDPEIIVVGEAKDGLDVVYQAERTAPDVILMDIRMPGQNGLDAAQEILARSADVEIIALTNYDTPQLRAAARAAGMHAYLPKSTDAEVLLATIHAVGTRS